MPFLTLSYIVQIVRHNLLTFTSTKMNHYNNNTINDSILNWNMGGKRKNPNLFGDTNARMIVTAKTGTSELGTPYITLQQGSNKRVICPMDNNTFVCVTNLFKASGVRVVGYAHHDGGYAFIVPYKYMAQLEHLLGVA